jgi:putative hemolysin
VTTWLSLAVAMGCVFAGSLVAGAEASIASMPDPRLRALADELGEPRARHIHRYLGDPHTLLSRWLTFRILMLVVASQLVARALVPDAKPLASALVLLAFVAVWAAIVEIFSSIGRARAAKLTPLALEITRPVEWLMAPIAAPVAALARRATKRASAEPEESDRSVIEREVEYVVEAAENQGALDPRRGEMLQNVLEFKDVTVRDVMVPRTKINALPARTPCVEALVLVSDEAHSRVPVYDGAIDNVVGILHVKDLFRQVGAQLAKGIAPADIKGTLLNVIRKPVLQVPPTQSAMQLLRDMQSRRTHMAVVIDEFGAVAGLVTLEDVLEELVGDIADEHDDVEDAEFVEQATGQYVAAAAIAIGELSERLGVEFPDDEGYASLGGFLAERAGRVPVPGTVVQWEGFTFTVREGDARRATKVEIVVESKQRAATETH